MAQADRVDAGLGQRPRLLAWDQIEYPSWDGDRLISDRHEFHACRADQCGAETCDIDSGQGFGARISCGPNVK